MEVGPPVELVLSFKVYCPLVLVVPPTEVGRSPESVGGPLRYLRCPWGHRGLRTVVDRRPPVSAE